MPDDFDDDAKTPEQGRMRPLTDSELEFFKVKYTSGVPVIGEFDDREDTSPIDLFDRAPRPAARDIVARLRQNPEKVIPFLGELAEWVALKMRERSSSEQSALTELRELLSRPPNGATKRLQEDVRGHAEAIGELADRLDAIERTQEKLDERVAKIEQAFEGAKGKGWKAALAIGTTIAGSAVAIVATLQAHAEKNGAATERVSNHGARLDRIERRLDDAPQRPSHRDYDFDITPRPFVPPKKDP
jgi:hypothetical protein